MLRNKELRCAALIHGALTLLLSILGFALHPAAGVMALASSVILGAAFWGFTAARYRRIASLSEQIDLVLHNADRLLLTDGEEGELSILQSEITKMTLRIREQNDLLRQEKKLLADSMADIAHQFRTPMTSVNIILSLLSGEADAAEREKLLGETRELLARMDYLITALLGLSRLDAGVVVFQNAPVEIRTLVQTALRPLQIPMELHGIDVRTDITAGVTVTGDAGWLSEALQNILKNCMESTGDNGSIAITGTDTPLYTELCIRDSGAGFPPDELPHLFERFYRGRNSGATGYGIGLALCRSIVTRQGGTVTAKNHPQGGAVFTLRFPK